jgi:hypothetical protein
LRPVPPVVWQRGGRARAHGAGTNHAAPHHPIACMRTRDGAESTRAHVHTHRRHFPLQTARVRQGVGVGRGAECVLAQAQQTLIRRPRGACAAAALLASGMRTRFRVAAQPLAARDQHAPRGGGVRMRTLPPRKHLAQCHALKKATPTDTKAAVATHCCYCGVKDSRGGAVSGATRRRRRASCAALCSCATCGCRLQSCGRIWRQRTASPSCDFCGLRLGTKKALASHVDKHLDHCQQAEEGEFVLL